MAHAMTVVAETAEHSAGLPGAAVGILAMGAFVLLLLVTLAFRSVGSRHQEH